MERLINVGKKQFSFWKQCQYLRCLLLEEFGGLEPLEGGSFASYVFDMKHGNRRLCRRKDLTELYRSLLCQIREVAATIKRLLPHSEATISPLSLELVDHCNLITEESLAEAVEYHAPCMQLNELAHQCFVLLKQLIELFGAWKTVSEEVKSNTVARLALLVPGTTEAGWLSKM